MILNNYLKIYILKSKDKIFSSKKFGFLTYDVIEINERYVPLISKIS